VSGVVGVVGAGSGAALTGVAAFAATTGAGVEATNGTSLALALASAVLSPVVASAGAA